MIIDVLNARCSLKLSTGLMMQAPLVQVVVGRVKNRFYRLLLCMDIKPWDVNKQWIHYSQKYPISHINIALVVGVSQRRHDLPLL